MRRTNTNERVEYPLTNRSIDEIADRVQDYLDSLKMEPKNQLRIRLSMENILLDWQERFGDNVVCTLQYGVRFGRPYLLLELPGESFDPLPAHDEDFSGWSSRMLASMGLCPVYQYVRGINQVLLKLKKPKRNPIFALLCSVGMAVLVGLMGTFLPKDLVALLLENLIGPVYETFLGVLGTIAGPMVFLAVAWGIYGIGDITVLGRIGKRMLLRFFGIMFLMVGVTAGMSALLFDLRFAAGQNGNASQLWSIFHMLLDIFPDNIISPFLDGNSMQIILSAAFVGSALLLLGKQTQAVALLIEQINYIVNFLMELISALVPYFIFIVVVQMFWTDSFGVVTQAWKALLVFLAVMAAILLFVFLRVGSVNRVSPLLLAKKCLETFMVALTTASSTAAFGTAMSCCERKLGVSSHLTNFGIPLGIVFYAPATAAYFLISNFYMAEGYGVEVSFAWVVMAVFLSGILAVASPPIPGGTLACYTVMFTQLGIPQEALVVALTIDVLFDFMATAINMVLLELELTQQGSRMELLDRDTLRAAKAAPAD